MGCKKENQGLTGQKKGLLLTVRNGFSPYILLRLARFFFYCQNVVQIFPAIFGVVDQQSGIENVVSDEYIFFIDRKGKTDIIPIPTVFSIFTVFFFAVFFKSLD